ncbi:endoplasmic reticulum junction formation protein lunapark-B isoform X2 [Venturia canescens]|uniref:endoplasmic reticulum junction formation protein lunapark-B isoform X2 n=1 Tax=Venturia canescens TaxID=32260 RepID=UPI001C9BE6EA|nr:endoplasmic reticulum junction formation protein lunapark-B isoform X2 [Venturia canescens]
MGILFSRFRKKKTTIEVLEDLDTKIKEIQQYGQTTEQRHKKIVGTLIIWSVALYIIAAVVFYFYFFPASLRDRFFYITPLLIFPLVIILTKRMVTWYYNRKISRNRDKLSTMQQEKKKILDEVTETETYKKAKEILMKFAPDQLRMTPLSPQQTFNKPTVVESPRRPSTPQAVVAPLPGGSELRRRALTVSNPSANASMGRLSNVGVVPVGVAPAITPQRLTPFQQNSRSFNAATIGARSPLPRPILPQQRSYLDRLVEYLVGDGPSNRYALICQMCESHNGMALKEEFEFFGFRCCYCNFWNPARKQKPSAPRLEDPTSPQLNLQSPKISDLEISSASSSSDSDIEIMEKPSDHLGPETEKDTSTEPRTEEEKTSENVDEENFGNEGKLKEENNPLEEEDDKQNEKMEVDESPKK